MNVFDFASVSYHESVTVSSVFRVHVPCVLFSFHLMQLAQQDLNNLDWVRYLSVTEKLMTLSPNDALSDLKAANNYDKKADLN